MTDYVGGGGGGGTALVPVGRAGRECTPVLEEEEAESGSTGGGVAGKAKKVTMGAIDVARKPRGRPPGSKNKPKPPIVITRDAENAMRPHVLELCAGCDVIESVAQFARRHHLGLCVISGKGTVANVSLHHPAAAGPGGRPPATTLTFHGRFDILSLTGTYLLPACSSSPSTSSFTISLAGAQGQVVGGTVAGSLVAAGPVVLIAAAFNNPSFHRLPADDEDSGNARMSGGGGGVKKENEAETDACSMSMYNPLSCQLPHDAFTWVPSSRTPPPY